MGRVIWLDLAPSCRSFSYVSIGIDGGKSDENLSTRLARLGRPLWTRFWSRCSGDFCSSSPSGRQTNLKTTWQTGIPYCREVFLLQPPHFDFLIKQSHININFTASYFICHHRVTFINKETFGYNLTSMSSDHPPPPRFVKYPSVGSNNEKTRNRHWSTYKTPKIWADVSTLAGFQFAYNHTIQFFSFWL